jgi:hypothetical protein
MKRPPGKAPARTRSTGLREPPADALVDTLALELGTLIESARQQVAQAANAALTTRYWQVGHRVRTEVLEGRSAEYGAQIVAALGRLLETRHGRGFGQGSRMKLSTVSRELHPEARTP